MKNGRQKLLKLVDHSGDMRSLYKSFMAAKPFPCLVIDQFLSQRKCKELLSALQKEKFTLKESDLFTFWQSSELKDHLRFSSLVQIFQSSEWKQKIFELTRIPISSEIDLFGSLYQSTNHLLPHDDRLAGRRIAFVFFLNTLKKNQGGRLQLFQENKVTKKITPASGRLVLFAVSSQSVHSVEEVYFGKRWALSGWFHG
ncbi:2OG-Fe(II) oxygenase [Candidatus Woesearchaeota archaeon]|nr:2OG-Fe(II) oxygenase [Candidatus Woesearchaeota archaeon]